MKYPPMLASPSTSQGRRAPISPHDLEQQQSVTDGSKLWHFEPKYDGMRAIAECHKGEWVLWSRNGRSLDIPQEQLQALFWDKGWPGEKHHDLVLDGELIASSFSDLMPWAKAPRSRSKPRGLRYVAFDLLEYEGVPLLDSPQAFRSAMVHEIPAIHTAPRVPYAHAMELSTEGVIAKHCAGLYVPGQRTTKWIKFKRTSVITVIAYMADERKRSLHLAVPGSPGMPRVMPVGSVGSGINDILFDDLRNRLPLVIEVGCMGRSTGGLRFPTFKRTRPDLDVNDVTRDEYDALPTY